MPIIFDDPCCKKQQGVNFCEICELFGLGFLNLLYGLNQSFVIAQIVLKNGQVLIQFKKLF